MSRLTDPCRLNTYFPWPSIIHKWTPRPTRQSGQKLKVTDIQKMCLFFVCLLCNFQEFALVK